MSSETPIGAREHQQMTRKHVLCVNGAPSFLDFVRDLLQDERYNVTTTNYVPRTFDLIESIQPDLVILDIVVGVGAGWELLEQLADGISTCGIPQIVTSTSQDLLERAEELANPNTAQRYLIKPFDITSLLVMVQELIGAA